MSSSALPEAHHHPAAYEPDCVRAGKELVRHGHRSQRRASPRSAASLPFTCHLSLGEVLAMQGVAGLT